MGLSETDFYDDEKIAIVPMGFCYPGRGRSGDLPPRKECAELWRGRIHSLLPNIRMTVLIGTYAQAHYLKHSYGTLTEVVKRWREFSPEFFPLPHPSPRNNLWLKKNPWFEEVIMELRIRIDALLSDSQPEQP